MMQPIDTTAAANEATRRHDQDLLRQIRDSRVRRRFCGYCGVRPPATYLGLKFLCVRCWRLVREAVPANENASVASEASR